MFKYELKEKVSQLKDLNTWYKQQQEELKDQIRELKNTINERDREIRSKELKAHDEWKAFCDMRRERDELLEKNKTQKKTIDNMNKMVECLEEKAN